MYEQLKELWDRLQKREDLVEYEGPLLSLFADPKTGGLYLVSWMDCDNWTNKWLVFNATATAVLGFKDGVITLKECIEQATLLFFINLDKDLIVVDIRETTAEGIPADLMPGDESFKP
jgi:hypothetical protein